MNDDNGTSGGGTTSNNSNRKWDSTDDPNRVEVAFTESESVIHNVKGGHRFRVCSFPSYQTIPSKSLSSKRFFLGGHEWQLVCYPGGETEAVSGHVSLFIGYRGPDPECQASWLLRCVNQVDGNANRERNWSKGDRYNTFNMGRRWGWQRFIRRDTLLDPEKGFIKNGTVIFEVELIVHGQIETIAKPVVPLLTRPPIPPNSLSTDMLDLFISGHLSDVVFVLDGGSKVINAHSQILAARSPVMARMFCGRFAETAKKEKIKVSIPDIDGEIFEELLRYAYTGELNEKLTVLQGTKDYSQPSQKHKMTHKKRKRKKRSTHLSRKKKTITNKETATTGSSSSSKKHDECCSSDYEDDADGDDENSDDGAQNISSFVAQLLQAADKYEFNTARLGCEYYLSSIIDSTNVSQLLTLADQHNAQHLKMDCMRFLVKKDSTINPQDFSDMRTGLVVELLEFSLDKINNKGKRNNNSINEMFGGTLDSGDGTLASILALPKGLSTKKKMVLAYLQDLNDGQLRNALTMQGLSAVGERIDLANRLLKIIFK